jgi:hypothetical protein
MPNLEWYYYSYEVYLKTKPCRLLRWLYTLAEFNSTPLECIEIGYGTIYTSPKTALKDIYAEVQGSSCNKQAQIRITTVSKL